MRTESVTQKNTSSGIVCTAPWRVASVKPLANYTLEILFIDDTRGRVEMARWVNSDKAGVFAALKDTTLFNQVGLEQGVVTWPGELDLAPDAMYDEIKHHGRWILK